MRYELQITLGPVVRANGGVTNRLNIWSSGVNCEREWRRDEGDEGNAPPPSVCFFFFFFPPSVKYARVDSLCNPVCPRCLVLHSTTTRSFSPHPFPYLTMSPRDVSTHSSTREYRPLNTNKTVAPSPVLWIASCQSWMARINDLDSNKSRLISGASGRIKTRAISFCSEILTAMRWGKGEWKMTEYSWTHEESLRMLMFEKKKIYSY